MSYEGYSQFLCKENHYWEVDCNMTAMTLEENDCPVCHAPAVWENMVDVTNGSYEDDDEMGTGKRIDGFIELEVLSEDKCDKCGSILERKYKIPNQKEQSSVRFWDNDLKQVVVKQISLEEIIKDPGTVNIADLGILLLNKARKEVGLEEIDPSVISPKDLDDFEFYKKMRTLKK